MLNHFVIANWYNEDNNYTIGQANTFVKIMKYYSGAEISGQVVMSDNGNALPGVRLLIERDAFSGEAQRTWTKILTGFQSVSPMLMKMANGHS